MDARNAVGNAMSSFCGCESLVVVGLGNIGSQVVALLGGMPEIRRVTLIDFDHYESGNLGFQRIIPRDVGQAKARVQARALRRMRPDLAVSAYVCRFEDVALGVLRDSIILSCVDARVARQSINWAGFGLGSPWIDAALAREGSVRARAFLPGRGACLECGWGPRDYELLEQRLPCASGKPAPAASAAPPELGAIVAGIQISLCRRIYADAAAVEGLADRQWFFDAASGRGWTGIYAPNPACRLDHAPWDITVLDRGSIDMPLHDALALAGTAPAETSLSAPGRAFVRRLRCMKCQRVRRVHWRLSARMGSRLCAACGAPLLAAATDAQAHLSASNAPAAVLREPLARRGLGAGDIVALGAAGTSRHFQLA